MLRGVIAQGQLLRVVPGWSPSSQSEGVGRGMMGPGAPPVAGCPPRPSIDAAAAGGPSPRRPRPHLAGPAPRLSGGADHSRAGCRGSPGSAQRHGERAWGMDQALHRPAATRARWNVGGALPRGGAKGGQGAPEVIQRGRQWPTLPKIFAPAAHVGRGGGRGRRGRRGRRKGRKREGRERRKGKKEGGRKKRGAPASRDRWIVG